MHAGHSPMDTHRSSLQAVGHSRVTRSIGDDGVHQPGGMRKTITTKPSATDRKGSRTGTSLQPGAAPMPEENRLIDTPPSAKSTARRRVRLAALPSVPDAPLLPVKSSRAASAVPGGRPDASALGVSAPTGVPASTGVSAGSGVPAAPSATGVPAATGVSAGSGVPAVPSATGVPA